MPIREEFLKDNGGKNYIEAGPGSTPREIIAQLRRTQGANDNWHIVLKGNDGKWRISIAHKILKRVIESPQLMDATLSELDLPPAHVVDQNDMGGPAALEQARSRPDKVIVVTANGALIGVVAEVVKRSGEGSLLAQFATAGDGGRPSMAASAPPGSPSQPRSFEAYPDLQAPERVPPETEFNVTVGFRATEDKTLAASQKVVVRNITTETGLQVVLLADGADIMGEAVQPLAFNMSAQARFRCRAKPDVASVVITAQYFYNSQLVGLAKRHVPVATANVYPIPSGPAPRANARGLGAASAEAQTDLQVTISKTRDGYLHWTFITPHAQIQSGPVVTELSDAREFAGGIINDLRTQGFMGLLAARILENVGQDIADIMPHEFFDALAKVHQAVGRAPTVLLYTNEPYVPWELAVLPRKLDDSLPPFLSTQAVVGRWLLDEGIVFPPPTLLDVQQFTAIVADYDIMSGISQLPNANLEQQMLKDKHGATAIDAKPEEIAKLVEPAQPGHLVHFALHGLSTTQTNEQALLMSNGSRLVSRALGGSHQPGDTPPFAFVFLNACQVGTAGSAFGQAAGFPGDVVRGGAYGFIAPLWEVDDKTALEMSEAFYVETLLNQKTVAETLRALRIQKFNRQGHTTPLAYIYYGHPELKLMRGVG